MFVLHILVPWNNCFMTFSFKIRYLLLLLLKLSHEKSQLPLNDRYIQ